MSRAPVVESPGEPRPSPTHTGQAAGSPEGDNGAPGAASPPPCRRGWRRAQGPPALVEVQPNPAAPGVEHRRANPQAQGAHQRPGSNYSRRPMEGPPPHPDQHPPRMVRISVCCRGRPATRAAADRTAPPGRSAPRARATRTDFQQQRRQRQQAQWPGQEVGEPAHGPARGVAPPARPDDGQ